VKLNFKNMTSLWSKAEILEALSDQLLEHNLSSDFEIDEVVIDSRKTPKSGLFIALKGENHDAHAFLEQALNNGCQVAIVSDQEKFKSLATTTYAARLILVKDTFAALYKLAEFSRKRSSAKIIAVTGSVGKTSTKEMLKLVFDTQGKTFATAGNLNNHIGLPLSLCNFSATCQFGIFEMGMNHLGEIEPLSKLAQPHLAVITTVGPVHIEFFKNEEEIALAKSEIFTGLVENGIALINRDNHHFAFLEKRAKACKIKDQNIFKFGKEDSCDYQIVKFHNTSSATSVVEIKLKNNTTTSYEIATSNPATISNSIIVVACLDLLGNNFSAGINALKNLPNFDGRGKIYEAKTAEKTITIIDDSYNASVPSMLSGLDYAMSLKKTLSKKRLVVALGDMRELGEKSVELHEEVANYLLSLHCDFAVLVGENMSKAATILPKNSYKTFSDSSSAALEIKDFLQDGDLLYVKGSRGTKMEKIIEQLTNQKSVH
jgi:UDP-N-acetylmuramoyl-tripeptide--D-alanyl-D-alanine ligase